MRASVYTSSPPITPFPFPPFMLHNFKLHPSASGVQWAQGGASGFGQKKQLICSSVIFGYETLNKRKPHSVEGSGGVDEGRERSVRLPGLFLFLVSIRCQTNDAVSRNSTQQRRRERGSREGGGGSNGCRSVGRSVGRLHSHSASRDSDAAAVSTLINIIKECASCVMHGGVDGVRGGRLVPLRNGMERGKREATAFFR